VTLDLQAVRGDLAAAIVTGTGLPVTLDPRNVQAPCVIVGPAEVLALSFDGSTGTVAVDVYLCATPPGNGDALAWLGPHVAPVAVACGAASAQFVGYSPSPGVELPAYLFRPIITTTR
jgi:hypothetical protein